MDISDRDPRALHRSQLEDQAKLMFENASMYGFLLSINYTRKIFQHPETGEVSEAFEWIPQVKILDKPQPE